MLEAMPLKSKRSWVLRKLRSAEAVPLSVSVLVPLPATDTAASLPLTLRIGVAPAGPAPRVRIRVRTSVEPAMALAQRNSPLVERSVKADGRAREGRLPGAAVPVPCTTSMVAVAVPLMAILPLPFTLRLALPR